MRWASRRLFRNRRKARHWFKLQPTWQAARALIQKRFTTQCALLVKAWMKVCSRKKCKLDWFKSWRQEKWLSRRTKISKKYKMSALPDKFTRITNWIWIRLTKRLGPQSVNAIAHFVKCCSIQKRFLRSKGLRVLKTAVFLQSKPKTPLTKKRTRFLTNSLDAAAMSRAPQSLQRTQKTSPHRLKCKKLVRAGSGNKVTRNLQT